MNAIKGLWAALGMAALCVALGTSLGLVAHNAKPLPRPDARKAGAAVGKTTGKFFRGFIQGVKDSK